MGYTMPNNKHRIGGRRALTALTVLLALLLLLANLGFTALAQALNLYIDETSEGRYTVRDRVWEILEEADIQADVDITFCAGADLWLSGEYTSQVYRLALEMEKHLPFLHLHTVDISADPEAVAAYRRTSATVISSSDVIIESGEEFRVLNVLAFFTRDSDTESVVGFNGEQKMTETILSLTSHDLPLACFTTGQGERIPRADDPETAALYETIRAAGFTIAQIDLSVEDIPDSCTLLIINGPTSDFPTGRFLDMQYDSPITKIDRFLDDFGCVFYFRDPEAGTLPVLEEFLAEWGVGFSTADTAGTGFANCTVRDGENAISGDPTRISGIYGSSSAFEDIASLSSPPKTVFHRAAALSVLWPGDAGSLNSNGRVIERLFTTSDTATATDATGGTVREGSFPLLTMTHETRVVDSEYMTATLFVCSTTEYWAPAYLGSTAYANSEVLISILRGAAATTVSVAEELEFKYYNDRAFTESEDDASNVIYARDEEGNILWRTHADGTRERIILRTIRPITDGEKTAWLWVLVILPVVALAGAGTFVCLRRRGR